MKWKNIKEYKIHGFALVDLIVSMSIMTLIMSVVFYNYRTFNDKIAVSTAVQEMAVAVRQAQTFGTAVKEVAKGTGNFSTGYGVSFDTANPQAYVIFADKNNNGKYDGDMSCAAGSECVEKDELRNNVVISALCGTDQTGSVSCPPLAAKSVSVIFPPPTFQAPNPDLNITFLDQSGNALGTYRDTSITLQSPLGNQASLTIGETGQIYVQGTITTDLTSSPSTVPAPIITSVDCSTPPSQSGTFAAKVDYSTSVLPNSVSVGDLNGDGKSDITVANNGNSSVSVFVNNGNGTFASKVNYATGATPWTIVTSDLNGDGKNDVATANANSGTVSVLINNGNGTFAPKVDYSVGGSALKGMVAADFNGDGKPDLAVSNGGSSSVSVLMNNGNGTFGTQVDYTTKINAITGSSPWGIAAGDVNGDGKPDIVVVSPVNAVANVFINNGDGTFASKVDYAVGGPTPRFVALGDVNGDSKLDMAVTNNANNTVSVLLNNGDGTFATKVDYTTGSKPTAVTLRDVNGDGKPDLEVVNTNGATVSILMNNGNGTFASKVDYATGATPNFLAVGDFNADGQPDIAVANTGAATVSVLLNNYVQSQTTVNLTGSNFTATGNTVKFSGTQTYIIPSISSTNGGQNMTVNLFMSPDTYNVSDANINGTSNTVSKTCGG